MISIIQNLVFDKELVKELKDSKLDKNFLYTQLISGKITLQEYIVAVG